MLRILHLLSVVCLVAAAVAVYKVKYESTYEAQRTAQLRNEIRIERERLSMLRAEWALLTAPQRIQDLASRHLDMQPIDVARFDDLSDLPEKPVGADAGDSIGEFIDILAEAEPRNDPLGDFLRRLNEQNSSTAGADRQEP